MSSPQPAARPLRTARRVGVAGPAHMQHPWARLVGDLAAHAGHPAYDNGTLLGVLLENIEGPRVAATLSQ